MSPFRSLAAFAAAVALVAAACDDPFAPAADFPVFGNPISLFAMSETPPSFPSVINLFNIQTGILQAGAQFDLAFDIDDAGNAVIYPSSRVIAGALTVGLRDTVIAFEDLDRAPRGTYPAVDSIVVTPGTVVIAEVQSQVCQFQFSPFFYSKVVVDSIDLDLRQLFLRVVTDPNCGFRSFVTGEIPGD